MPTGSRDVASDSTQGTEPIEYDTKAAAKFQTKSQSHYIDPCQDFAERSIKCLHRNGNDKDLCNDYFQAYRDCKKQWLEARREQRRKEGKWF